MDFLLPLSDLERSIVSRMSPLLAGLGFELYRLRVTGQSHRAHLAVYVDRSAGQGSIQMADLERLSHLLSDALDVWDNESGLFGGSYNLEVSSPGVERPLATRSHFEGAVGKVIKVKTDGQQGLSKQVVGTLEAVLEDAIQLALGEGNVQIPFVHMKDAHEVFTFEKPAKGKKR